MYREQRASARTLCRLRVIVAGVAAVTADVTANGFCVETNHLVKPGTSLTGSIALDGREFAFAGVVCWTRAEDPQHGRMGVRFLEVPPEFKAQFSADR
jgi:hypothetical protein